MGSIFMTTNRLRPNEGSSYVFQMEKDEMNARKKESRLKRKDFPLEQDTFDPVRRHETSSIEPLSDELRSSSVLQLEKDESPMKKRRHKVSKEGLGNKQNYGSSMLDSIEDLIERDTSIYVAQVIVADNFFTGLKDNLKKWIGHLRF
ncbi:UDP-glucuronic acid decarboxylase 6 [Acorus calamus]|uniref:UDP-glucuronic acid decarboxylase 6 n=1 Tax=Acorus calamus TaxID=4465 RepID=A0AAV9DRE8_ACOCL|nr:UDP-glucuronic acid decarboxylase 6 [Acorus calamus]